MSSVSRLLLVIRRNNFLYITHIRTLNGEFEMSFNQTVAPDESWTKRTLNPKSIKFLVLNLGKLSI